MKTRIQIFFTSLSFLLFSSIISADTLTNKTISGIFINNGSLVAFKYLPVDNVNNPENCNLSYLELNKNSTFFKEQYSLLLMLMATGKKVNINVGTACGSNYMLANWFFVHE